ncbi:sensor histidine kinase [Trichothermofontia sp.]
MPGCGGAGLAAASAISASSISAPTAGWVRCGIADDGIGLTPEQRDRLFELYEQGPQTRQLFTGMGLGLYLCRQIIQAHGDEIGVISEPNAGAVFWFKVPCA